MLTHARAVADGFALEGEIVALRPYGAGHINGTFLVETTRRRYILQRVNPAVFPHPAQVMANVERVTAYLRARTADERAVLSLIPTRAGRAFVEDEEGGAWRVYPFIEESVCLERAENTVDLYECARAFGRFQHDLSGFPAATLYETIPGFHDTAARFAAFEAAVAQDEKNRAATCQVEIAFLRARANFYAPLTEAAARGDLPLRVVHNDTKTGNVLLDRATRKALCVIDLDTVMPGYAVTDFGDIVRSGASTAAEDEKDPTAVRLDPARYEACRRGYLDGCDGDLTPAEIALLPTGAYTMILECGMRFLTDYLRGDVYFKVDYPTHNLVRARTQLALAADMEAQGLC